MHNMLKEKLEAINRLISLSGNGERMSEILMNSGFTTDQVDTIRKKYMDEFVDSVLTEFSQLIVDVAFDVLLSEQ